MVIFLDLKQYQKKNQVITFSDREVSRILRKKKQVEFLAIQMGE